MTDSDRMTPAERERLRAELIAEQEARLERRGREEAEERLARKSTTERQASRILTRHKADKAAAEEAAPDRPKTASDRQADYLLGREG
jgi:hypothetical protein